MAKKKLTESVADQHRSEQVLSIDPDSIEPDQREPDLSTAGQIEPDPIDQEPMDLDCAPVPIQAHPSPHAQAVAMGQDVLAFPLPEPASSGSTSGSTLPLISTPSSPQTLAIDIGGSGIKVMVLDASGIPVTERERLATPQPATLEAVLALIDTLARSKAFDRISVGFPGVVRQGRILTAVNLDPSWVGFDLATHLTERFNVPTRVANDADIQGFGVIAGTGVELVITLGTGFGSALFVNGQLVPNLELGHHVFRKGETYEEQLGRAALDRVGKKRWNDRLLKAIATLEHLFNYDYLYMGGGNAKKVQIEFPANVTLISNQAGILGGITLWRSVHS